MIWKLCIMLWSTFSFDNGRFSRDNLFRLLVNLTKPPLVCFDGKLPKDVALTNVYLNVEVHLQKTKTVCRQNWFRFRNFLFAEFSQWETVYISGRQSSTCTWQSLLAKIWNCCNCSLLRILFYLGLVGSLGWWWFYCTCCFYTRAKHPID